MTDASPGGAGGPATGSAVAPPGANVPSTTNPPASNADAGGSAGASAQDGPSAAGARDEGGVALEGGDDRTGGAIPTPATVPYVWGVGIGITDVPSAVKFYTGVMQMNVEQSNVQRDDRTETVLFASQAKRGSRLVLMNFNDKRNTEDITAKLVWQASNPTGVSTAAAGYPGYVSRLAGGVIVQFDGPETYIQEVGSGFDTGGAGLDVPYLIALGMSVSNQPASRQFYMTAFGMTEALTGTFQVTDATGTGTITEYTEQYSTQGGAAIVLQAWTPPRNSKNSPVKIVLFVPDAQAAADKVAAAGGTIVKTAERTPVYGNRKLVVAQDPDGYILELVE
ncbi:MAG TPA: VOC family protein [Polyangiaceae bacterium]|nr:VOC family protein [Polyangiaceae bacterium]